VGVAPADDETGVAVAGSETVGVDIAETAGTGRGADAGEEDMTDALTGETWVETTEPGDGNAAPADSGATPYAPPESDETAADPGADEPTPLADCLAGCPFDDGLFD
jgi:hypothetical protein